MTLIRFDYPRAVGWQARSRGKSGPITKFFSDRVYGGNEPALAAAKAYAAEYDRWHPEEGAGRDIDRVPRRNNRSGVPGVSLVCCSPRSPTGHAWTFWQASCPGGPEGDRPQWAARFTCSIHGFERARQLAEEFRAAWVTARDSGKLDEFWARHGARIPA